MSSTTEINKWRILFTIVIPLIIGAAISYLLDSGVNNLYASTAIGLIGAITTALLTEVIMVANHIYATQNSLEYFNKIVEDFKEHDFIYKTLKERLGDDIKFNNLVKNGNKHLPHDLFFQKIKYQNYLKDGFKGDPFNQTISNIPINYFQNEIWQKLLDRVNLYYSIQVIDQKTIEPYLKNKDRLEGETNYLKSCLNSKKKNLHIFKKLFVIDHSLISDSSSMLGSVSESGVQLKIEDIITYLEGWGEVGNQIGPDCFKVIFNKDIIGILNIEDSGLFGNVLGTQEVRQEFGERKVEFKFSFNHEKTTKYKEDFEALFENGQTIDEFVGSVQ